MLWGLEDIPNLVFFICAYRFFLSSLYVLVMCFG